MGVTMVTGEPLEGIRCRFKRGGVQVWVGWGAGRAEGSCTEASAEAQAGADPKAARARKPTSAHTAPTTPSPRPAERDEGEFARLSQLGDILGLSQMDVYQVGCLVGMCG